MKKMKILISGFIFSTILVLGAGIFSPLPQPLNKSHASASQEISKAQTPSETRPETKSVFGKKKKIVAEQGVTQELRRENTESTPEDQTPEGVTPETKSSQPSQSKEIHLTKESTAQSPSPSSNQRETSQSQPTSKARVEIEGLGSYSTALKGEETAFDILVKTGQENNFTVGYTMYSFGPFISSIGSKSGDASHYWAFYYNASYSNVGAGDQKVKNGDITTWRYQSF